MGNAVTEKKSCVSCQNASVDASVGRYSLLTTQGLLAAAQAGEIPAAPGGKLHRMFQYYDVQDRGLLTSQAFRRAFDVSATPVSLMMRATCIAAPVDLEPTAMRSLHSRCSPCDADVHTVRCGGGCRVSAPQAWGTIGAPQFRRQNAFHEGRQARLRRLPQVHVVLQSVRVGVPPDRAVTKVARLLLVVLRSADPVRRMGKVSSVSTFMTTDTVAIRTARA